jgi:hypothetical protein
MVSKNAFTTCMTREKFPSCLQNWSNFTSPWSPFTVTSLKHQANHWQRQTNFGHTVFWDITPCSPLICQLTFQSKLHTAFSLFATFFNLEDGGNKFLQNVSWLSTNYMVLCKIWGFHGDDYEEYRLLWCSTVWLWFELTFWKNVCSHLLTCDLVLFTISSSETSVQTRPTRCYILGDNILHTWCYIPDDGTLPNHHWEPKILNRVVQSPDVTIPCSEVNSQISKHLCSKLPHKGKDGIDCPRIVRMSP